MQRPLVPADVLSATRSNRRSLRNAVIGCFSQQFEQRGHCRGIASFFEPILARPGTGRGAPHIVQFRHIQVALLERAVSYYWCPRGLLHRSAVATIASVKSRLNSPAMSEYPNGTWLCWRESSAITLGHFGLDNFEYKIGGYGIHGDHE